MDSTLKKLLRKHLVRKGRPFTHVSLEGGNYMVDYQLKEEFWNLYQEYLEKGEHLFLAEQLDGDEKTFIPIIIDIDLKHSIQNGEVPIKLYTDEDITEIVNILQNEIDDTFQVEYNDLFCFLLEKPPRIEGDYIKSGFHLHFPIFVRRGLIISNLYPKVIEKIDECKLFQDFGGYEVLDKNMPKNDPIIYGGHKKEKFGYTLTKVFDPELKEVYIEEALQDYELYNSHQQLIPATVKNLPRIFSSFIDNRKTHELKANLVIDESKVIDVPESDSEEEEDEEEDEKEMKEVEDKDVILRFINECYSVEHRIKPRFKWFGLSSMIKKIFQ